MLPGAAFMNTPSTELNAATDAQAPPYRGFSGINGNKNLGDEAIIEAIINNLRHHLGDPEIYCFSIDPFDSAQRHGVRAFPIRYRRDFFAKHHGYIEPESASDQQTGHLYFRRFVPEYRLIRNSSILEGAP